VVASFFLLRVGCRVQVVGVAGQDGVYRGRYPTCETSAARIRVANASLTDHSSGQSLDDVVTATLLNKDRSTRVAVHALTHRNATETADPATDPYRLPRTNQT